MHTERGKAAPNADSQFAHMRVTRRLNPGTMGHSQCGASLLQKADTEVDALLFGGGKTISPFAESSEARINVRH